MLVRSVLLLSILSLVTAPQCRDKPKTSSAGDIVFAAAGDYGMSDDAANTLQLMGQSNAHFILALGDFSYSSTVPESNWCDYVRSKIGPTLPFQLIAGNHEDDYEGTGHLKNFAACLPDSMGSVGEYAKQYYFDYAGLARFIMISPDVTMSGEHYYYGDSNANYKWLVDAIDGARAAGIRWVIVGMHKSCLSMGPYYCRIYDDLMNLLVSKKVDLVLHAHEHNYQRTKQLAHGPACTKVVIDSFNGNCVVDDGKDGQYKKARGSVFVTVGTAGADLYDIDTKDSEAGYFASWMGANINPRKGFMKFVLSRNQISAEFVGSTTTSNFTDRFVISVN